MSTQTEKQYVVHLDIQTTALDLSGAVQDALDQVLLGERRNITYRVEEIEDGAKTAALPDQRLRSGVSFPGHDDIHRQHHRYPNEFLG